VEVSGSIVAAGTAFGNGGSISLEVIEDAIVTGLLNASGSDDDGGDIVIDAGGSVVLGSAERAAATVINIGVARGAGFGGELIVIAGDRELGDGDGAFELRGVVVGRGGSSLQEGGGDGGSVQVTADAACTIAGVIDVSSGVGEDVSGGSISLDCGQSGGGGVSSLAGAALLARASETGAIGGSIGIEAPGPIVLTATTVDSSGANAQELSIRSTGRPDSTVLLEGGTVVRADGTGPEGSGGDVGIEGCVAAVRNGARVTALGPGGEVTVTGVNRIEIGGELKADASTGSVRLVFRGVYPGFDSLPFIESTARFTPDRVEQANPALQGCGAPTPSSTATPTVTPTSPNRTPPTATRTRTPTLTPTATPTPAGPADTNCSGTVDRAEVEIAGLVRAIFDGRFCQSDPNLDRRGTNAADLVRLVRIVSSE